MRRGFLAGLALLLALAAAACGSSGENAHQSGQGGGAPAARSSVKVSGQPGSKPTISVDTPLKLSKSASWRLTTGTGPEVGENQQYVVNLTFADGRTGKTVASTYDQGQQPVAFSPSQSFPVITKAVTGVPAGSRVVVAAAPNDAYGSKGNAQLGIKPGDSVVMVVDVTSAQPTDVLSGPKGSTVKAPSGTPTLLTKGATPTGFDFAHATAKPKQLRVVPLVEGTGPKVQAGDLITVNYLGVVWGKHKPFDESYSRQPATFPIGLGRVIPAWDQGLVGIRQGSRVLLLCPPDTAYGAQGSGSTIPGNATLAFVVDVLGVG